MKLHSVPRIHSFDQIRSVFKCQLIWEHAVVWMTHTEVLHCNSTRCFLFLCCCFHKLPANSKVLIWNLKFEESIVTVSSALALGCELILLPTLAMKQRFHKWSLSLYKDYFKIANHPWALKNKRQMKSSMTWRAYCSTNFLETLTCGCLTDLFRLYPKLPFYISQYDMTPCSH